MWKLTPKIPRPRLQLLLCTNIGADTLGSYLTTTETAMARRWKLGLNQQQSTQEARQQKRMIGWRRLEDARDENQGSSRESGDEGEVTNEAVEGAE